MLLSILLFCNVAFAQTTDLTSKPVQVIIPFAPGGGMDIVFRHIQAVAASKNINMVAVYKPGADGMIGINALLSATPDGFTIGMTPASTIATYELANPGSVVPILTGLVSGIGVYVVRAESNINTFRDLREVLHNGAPLNVGYGAPGQKLMLEQLLEFVKPDHRPVMVPFKGGQPVLMALLGGHIDFAWLPYNVAQASAASGRIKILAISGTKIAEYPDVPFMPDRYKGWKEVDAGGVSVSPNIPNHILVEWKLFFKTYLEDPKTKEYFLTQSSSPVMPFGSEPLEKLVKNSKEKLQKMQ